jgi:hypothetical protein
VTKSNARQQFGVGNSAAQGFGRGTIGVGGKLDVYFKDFSTYLLYANETPNMFAVHLTDPTAPASRYILTLPSITVMNPQITAGGPDTDLMANFTLEGNPAYVPLTTTLFTIQIDKF